MHENFCEAVILQLLIERIDVSRHTKINFCTAELVNSSGQKSVLEAESQCVVCSGIGTVL